MALQLWVDFFEDLQHVRGRSHNTVMAYRRDLELYAVHDAPKQAVWSARGDLVVSGGDRIKVISAPQEAEDGLENGKEKEPERSASRISRGRQEDLTMQAQMQRPSMSRNVSSSHLPPVAMLPATTGSKKTHEALLLQWPRIPKETSTPPHQTAWLG